MIPREKFLRIYRGYLIMSVNKKEAPVIVVEGPDGTGKTTLALEIAQHFKIPYRRYEGLSPERGPDGGIVAWWDTQLRDQPMAVFDRCFYISELIYQLATPTRPLMVSGSRMMNGIRDLWSAEPFFVFCTAPWETQLENVRRDNRPRLKGVDDNALQKISWAYDSVCVMWENALFENVRRYTYLTSEDFQSAPIVGLISSYIERSQDGSSSTGSA